MPEEIHPAGGYNGCFHKELIVQSKRLNIL
jgi:hypothetical protein